MKACLEGGAHPLTDGTDNASVPGRDGRGVNVQAAHVLQECVRHGRVQLLGLNEGSPNVAVGLRHGFWNPGPRGIEERNQSEQPGSLIQGLAQETVSHLHINSISTVGAQTTGKPARAGYVGAPPVGLRAHGTASKLKPHTRCMCLVARYPAQADLLHTGLGSTLMAFLLNPINNIMSHALKELPKRKL